MKNKYKVAGVLNILFGLFMLSAIFLFTSILLILYFVERLEGLLILWFIFGVPMILFAIPLIKEAISCIRTGGQMISGKCRGDSFRRAVRLNIGTKMLFVFACVWAMFMGYIEQGNEMLIQGGYFLFFPIIILISVILDIVVLRKTKKL